MFINNFVFPKKSRLNNAPTAPDLDDIIGGSDEENGNVEGETELLTTEELLKRLYRVGFCRLKKKLKIKKTLLCEVVECFFGLRSIQFIFVIHLRLIIIYKLF